MIFNLIKKSLMVVLSVSMILTPVHINHAAEKNLDEIKTMEDVQNFAQKKAEILTTMYGETSVQYALIDNGAVTVSGQNGSNGQNMYGIASISKIFTTAAVMKLVDDGKVDLDKSVTDYITDFKMADSRYKNITVRMLLNHSSGLMGYTLSNAYLFADKDMRTYHDLLKELSTQRLKADPGEFSVYCNDGFSLAELLVERVSGMSFSEYISKNITSKLDMKDTYTSADNFDQSKLSKIYYPGFKTSLPTDNVNLIGPGGFYSTADDLCKFATAFMKNSSGILSKSSLTAMENNEYRRGIWSEEADSSLAYGLGWDCVNTYPFNQYNMKALFKGGDSMFYHSSLIVLPEHNMAIAVVSSGGSSDYNQVMGQEILLAALKAKGTISEMKDNKTIAIPDKAAMPEELKNYAGCYANYAGVFYISISDDGILSIMTEPSDSENVEKYIYGGNGKFYSKTHNSTAYVSFKTESNGKTYLYRASYSMLKGLGQTATSMYEEQKIKANPISDKLNSIWKNRAKKSYFLVSDKYSSELYITAGINRLNLKMQDWLPGYFENAAIIDENNAKTFLEISAVYGRDLKDYHFYKKNNMEYLKMGNVLYVSEDAVKKLPVASKFACTINKDGYGKYYKVISKVKDKTITVKIPARAAFIVYDKDGNCINDSYITGINSVKLPENGYVLFAGSANAKFIISVK